MIATSVADAYTFDFRCPWCFEEIRGTMEKPGKEVSDFLCPACGKEAMVFVEIEVITVLPGKEQGKLSSPLR